jgi:hypothetical protein
MARIPYPTDLTNDPWAVLASLPERPAGPRRPPPLALREGVNALLDQAPTGCGAGSRTTFPTGRPSGMTATHGLARGPGRP